MQLVWQPYLSKTRLLCVRNSRGGPSINTRGTPGAAACLSQEPLYLVGGGSDSLRHLGGGGGEDSAAPGQESLEVAVVGGSLTENGAPGSAPIPTPCPVRAGGVLGPGSVARYSEQRGKNRCFLESENNAGSQMGRIVEAHPLPTLCQGLAVWGAAKGGGWGLWHQQGTWCSIISHWSAHQGMGVDRGHPTQDEGQANPLSSPCPAAKLPRGCAQRG